MVADGCVADDSFSRFVARGKSQSARLLRFKKCPREKTGARFPQLRPVVFVATIQVSARCGTKLSPEPVASGFSVPPLAAGVLLHHEDDLVAERLRVDLEASTTDGNLFVSPRFRTSWVSVTCERT
jgi:hypothetical protein